ncbi:3'-5' exonuclease [Desulfosporosinus meridiei]|uniref:Inhibitor of the KinA pathway to sporulation, predicted exonuclease n=1 Tax=Desulfosporosinus meridiei (strain ATCC BAA-275 / DSM 13257 / KCTC 12902 / NCIMB 13706 / S10) TaxID=768704 RepID=J7IUA2_DESMD|nr:3'-5' exonuclease [Desulfosporosinus meridiei]AFQ43744.1 inhibitor of the KinA pathway to sporulation, predicted exonuclease [Desulfosporosinus meridiei DSM 13257]
MYFIIFDLEFNQDVASLQNFDGKGSPYPFEIIQIGAIKLDLELNTVGTFNRYVKPTFYTRINPFVTDLTGITTEQLLTEEPFSEIYKAYTAFTKERDSIFCTWGMSDITELFRNVEAQQLSPRFLPQRVINIQPYVSTHFNLSQKNLLRLQHAVELLHIPITNAFHNALHDAFYTAEIFKIVYNSSIQPKPYDPSYRTIRAKRPSRVIDTDKLLQQFEKMYARKITTEEKEMIQLAYKMGRTNQFLKDG